MTKIDHFRKLVGRSYLASALLAASGSALVGGSFTSFALSAPALPTVLQIVAFVLGTCLQAMSYKKFVYAETLRSGIDKNRSL